MLSLGARLLEKRFERQFFLTGLEFKVSNMMRPFMKDVHMTSFAVTDQIIPVLVTHSFFRSVKTDRFCCHRKPFVVE